MSLPILTRPAQPSDTATISAFHARVFGPGRFVRSAYRVREGYASLSRFCRVAEQGSKLIATLRLTEVRIGGMPGAVLLGPLAVEPEYRGQGYGKRLVAEAIEAMHGEIKLVVLVGDMDYYARFGFKPAAPGQIRFPGPVNPARILALELEPSALASYRGLVSA